MATHVERPSEPSRGDEDLPEGTDPTNQRRDPNRITNQQRPLSQCINGGTAHDNHTQCIEDNQLTMTTGGGGPCGLFSSHRRVAPASNSPGPVNNKSSAGYYGTDLSTSRSPLYKYRDACRRQSWSNAGAANTDSNANTLKERLLQLHTPMLHNHRRSSPPTFTPRYSVGDLITPSNYTPHTITSMLSENQSNRSESPEISSDTSDEYLENSLRSSPDHVTGSEDGDRSPAAAVEDAGEDAQDEPVDLKKARVESIVTSIAPPGGRGPETKDGKRNKRKQTQPQQHGYHSDEDEPSSKTRRLEKIVLQEQLKELQQQIDRMQNKLHDYKDDGIESRSNGTHQNGFLKMDTGSPDKPSSEIGAKLAKSLKSELRQQLDSIVDSVINKFVEEKLAAGEFRMDSKKETILNTPTVVPQRAPPGEYVSPKEHHQPQHTPKMERTTPDMPPAYRPRTKVSDRQSSPMSYRSPFSHGKSFLDFPRSLGIPSPFLSYYAPTQVPPPQSVAMPAFPSLHEQTEALSLVTPKKKRTKVTDTRLSPRAARALLQESVNVPRDEERGGGGGEYNVPTLPTSVAIPNPSLHQSDVLAMYSRHNDSFDGDQISPPMGNSGSPRTPRSPPDSHNMKSDQEATVDGHFLQTSTLTPMHLRKAKLIFFFCRYPSSAILKVYFPDIKFNKNNTAQLVKWFSNFREFYYIQMEKYARQSLAEAVTNADQVHVTTDSELYRILNLHYNRNNQIEVPDTFRQVVQSTLREFFCALKAGKDTEQSWKKPVYKVIARMDQPLPEFFKSSNWMERLAD